MFAKLVPPHLAGPIAEFAAEYADTPFREGQVYSVLVAAGYGVREIADLADVDWDRVDLCLALLGLVALGRDALDQGMIPLDLAAGIARLSASNQQLMLNRWIRGDFRNARHAERYAAAIQADEQPQLSL
ncbi:hypothetical protein AB0A05_07380 [Streptomyces sp. NPDC046374]|uniref:hypothetical protein n=1 Tax=Streptomyces sp. NPDC046374 TaxID=3154917 RepID=UPI0033D51D4B